MHAIPHILHKIGGILLILPALLLSCTSDSEAPVPEPAAPAEPIELHITLRAASPAAHTRATDDWLDPVSDNEKINNYTVILVQEGKVIDKFIKTLDTAAEQDEFTLKASDGSKYDIYAFANVTDQYDLSAITIGSTLPTAVANNTAVLKTVNGFSDNIPMTGCMKGVTVTKGENQAFTIEVVRAMAKLTFTINNKAASKIRVVGYEIQPLTKGDDGVSLFETTNAPKAPTVDDDEPTIPTASETETYEATLGTPIDIAKDANATVSVYINETNATATATKNQYSVRFKVKRKKNDSLDDSDTNWFDDEYHFGFTTPESTTSPYEGFTYIHRNDWIKIPVTFTDWEFRVEMLPYPPIAAFAAYVTSSDAISTTFNTGGYVCMRPLFRKRSESELWRNIDYGSVKFKLTGTYTETIADKHAESLVADTDPTYGGTGLILDGNLKIFSTKFARLGSTEYIVANLNNASGDEYKGSVTVTIRVRLDDGYLHEFTHKLSKL